MRKVLIVIAFFYVLICSAQNISVSSFKLLDTDLTANTAGTMEADQNGETAALIKVVTTQTGFTFDGGALGIVKTVQKPSEIWVYVPRGLKKITISHPQLGMLRDYYLNVPIEAARTYEMILVAGEVQTIVKQARLSQYVVFQLTPSNAIVELDGELLETVDGIASKMIKFGTYDYRVQAPNHFPEAGKVTIDDVNNKKVVKVVLKSNYSRVTVRVGNNAEIWINGEKKGNGNWTGDLGKGTYEFEAKLQGHRSTLTRRDIDIADKTVTIDLQEPMPIYGGADINSSPAMADIYIDGRKCGKTPEVINNLLVGEHFIRISKEGFEDYSMSMIVKEGDVSYVSVKLNEMPKENLKSVSDSYLKNQEYEKAIEYYQKYMDSKLEKTFEDYEGMAKVYLAYADVAPQIRMPELIRQAIIAYRTMGQLFPAQFIYATYQCATLYNKLDPTMSKGLAKPDYQKVVSLLENKNNRDKGENIILKYSYHYLMAYALLIDKKQSLSKKYADKLLSIDPDYAPAQQIRGL